MNKHKWIDIRDVLYMVVVIHGRSGGVGQALGKGMSLNKTCPSSVRRITLGLNETKTDLSWF